jgi:DNA-binding transcriptional LysR family regulator
MGFCGGRLTGGSPAHYGLFFLALTLPKCLARIASALPSADVSIEIHMVDDLLFAMIQQGAQQIAGAMPYIVINAQSSHEKRSLFGGNIWDRKTWPKSASEFVKDLETLHPESRFSFGRDARQLHDTVLQLHGLYPCIFEITERRGKLVHTRFYTDVQLPFEVQRTQIIDAIEHGWLNNHTEYLKELESILLYE